MRAGEIRFSHPVKKRPLYVLEKTHQRWALNGSSQGVTPTLACSHPTILFLKNMFCPGNKQQKKNLP